LNDLCIDNGWMADSPCTRRLIQIPTYRKLIRAKNEDTFQSLVDHNEIIIILPNFVGLQLICILITTANLKTIDLIE